MTPQVMQFVALQGSDGKTLEVGSADVNGSLRNYFTDYVGIDMRLLPGVDIVANGNSLPFEDEIFDRVLYLETMEHDEKFWETIKEITRVLKRGGKIIITTRAFGFILHDFPHDYYRFTNTALAAILRNYNYEQIEVLSETGDNGVFAHGVKP